METTVESQETRLRWLTQVADNITTNIVQIEERCEQQKCKPKNCEKANILGGLSSINPHLN
jgi:hypothetical protein